MYGLGVIAPLAGDDNVLLSQPIQIEGILQLTCSLAVNDWPINPYLRGRKERWFYITEVLLVLHALHQYRAHHTAPTDQSHVEHVRHLRLFLFARSFNCSCSIIIDVCWTQGQPYC